MREFQCLNPVTHCARLQLLIDEESILKWLHHTLSPDLRGTRCWSLFIGRCQKKDLKPPIRSSGLIFKCESYQRLLHAGNNCSETPRSQDKYTVGVGQPFTQLPMVDNYYPPTQEVKDHNDLSQGKSLQLCMHCTIKTGIIYAVANRSISSALLNSNSLFFPLKIKSLFFLTQRSFPSSSHPIANNKKCQSAKSKMS